MKHQAINLVKFKGRQRLLDASDIEVWRRHRGEKATYSHRHPRCRYPLAANDLPLIVVEAANRISTADPLKAYRKYYMDVTAAQWQAIREFVFDRDLWICVYCGQPAEHIDHVLPIAQFGSWHPDNCVAACAACNIEKCDRTPEQWRRADA